VLVFGVVPALAAGATAALVTACGAFTDASDAPVSGEGGLVAESGSDGGEMDGMPSSDAAHLDAAVEASVPIPRKCAVGTAFKNVTPLPIGRTESIESVRFSPDQSTAYFSLCNPSALTSCSLFSATKTDTTFTGFTPMLANSTGKYDAFATVSPGGTLMLFDSTRGTAVTRLFYGTLVNNMVPVSGVSALPFPSADPAVTAASHPYLLANGALYYAALGSTDFDLYRATGTSVAEVRGATRLSVSDPTATDFAPVVSEDELEMFWASDRPVPAGGGGLDIWSAPRTPMAPTGEFGNAEFAAMVSSPMQDHPVWLSPDACDLYIVRKDGSEVGTLSVAHR